MKGLDERREEKKPHPRQQQQKKQLQSRLNCQNWAEIGKRERERKKKGA